MREIRLTDSDLVALVDDEDYEWLSQREWAPFQFFGSGPFYAISGSHLMHRLLLNAPSGVLVDHRDRNPLNNQKDNLRFANRQQNAANRGAASNQTLPFKGLLKSDNGGYMARVADRNGSVRNRPEEAAIDYNAMAFAAYGEFARPNRVSTGLDLSGVAEQIGLTPAEAGFMVAITEGCAFHEAAAAIGLPAEGAQGMFDRIREKVSEWQDRPCPESLMVSQYGRRSGKTRTIGTALVRDFSPMEARREKAV